MKKKLLGLAFTMLAGLTIASCSEVANEDTPLILSSQELDKIFNPFFY